jgi:outer membrane protein assembly factor BamD
VRLHLTVPTLRRLIAMPLLVAGLAFAISACSSNKKELEYKEQSIYDIYSKAMTYVDNGRYKDAGRYFDEVERQHPYSVWATKAKLMGAYSYYKADEYDEAITRLDRFIQVHPGNRDIAYAYYLKALCSYERIADIRRDQEQTTKALDALEDVVSRFPDSPYGRDARIKVDLVRDHLAGREMDIGRFYLRNRQYLSAVNRFKTVVEQYGGTTHVPEALARLTEAYTALGLRTEAHKTAAVLGYNFPGTDWYKEAFALAGGDKTPLLAEVTPNGKPILTREAKNGQEAKAETGTQP